LAASSIGLVAAMVVTMLGQHGDESGDSAVVGRIAPSPPPLDVDFSQSDPSDPSKVTDRGVVSGVLRLRTDVSADAHTWVAYLFEGPTSMVRVAPQPPYRTDVDTRLLPDGQYTVNAVIFRPQSSPWVKSSRMRIANHGPVGSGRPGTAPPPPAPARPAPATPQPGTSSSPAPQRTRPAQTVATVLAGHPPSPTAAASPPAPDAGDSALAAQIVQLTNAERAQVGCAPLVVDPRLTAAARGHSADMAERNYFNHDGPDGRTPFQRINDAGYSFSVAAENIAAGQRTPQEVLTGWMNSPSHRANIVDCTLTNIGVGYASGGSYGTYWTEDFGTP
jgi:uncharacterized protein YkwD